MSALACGRYIWALVSGKRLSPWPDLVLAVGLAGLLVFIIAKLAQPGRAHPAWLMVVTLVGLSVASVSAWEGLMDHLRRLTDAWEEARRPRLSLSDCQSTDTAGVLLCTIVARPDSRRYARVDVYDSGKAVLEQEGCRWDDCPRKTAQIGVERAVLLGQAAARLEPHADVYGQAIKDWNPVVQIFWSHGGEEFCRTYWPDSARPQGDGGVAIPPADFPDGWREALQPFGQLLDELGIRRTGISDA